MVRFQHSLPARFKRRRMLRPALFSMPLFDELISGFPVVALPLIRDDFALSYQQAGLLFSAGTLAGLVLEPLINLISDRGSKRPLILAGLLGLAAGFALAAMAPVYAVLLLAFVLVYPSGGAAIGLAQAVLIDADLDAAPRTMARWTLMAGVGDLLSPTTVALLTAAGFGWRPLFWLAAALWLAAAVWVFLVPFPAPPAVVAEDDQPDSLGARLLEGLRAPGLLRWTVVLIAVDLLDEIFLGFAALYLSDALDAAPSQISLVLGAQMTGGLLGLALLDRIVGRISGRRLLPLYALVALAGGAALLTAGSVWVAAAALFVIGMGAAGLYPILKAAAYATLPGRSGTVRAVLGLGDPAMLVLPPAIGAIADRAGIAAGMALLCASPLLVLALSPRDRRRAVTD